MSPSTFQNALTTLLYGLTLAAGLGLLTLIVLTPDFGCCENKQKKNREDKALLALGVLSFVPAFAPFGLYAWMMVALALAVYAIYTATKAIRALRLVTVKVYNNRRGRL
ncbi:hypothetical protein A2716_05280 [candidate division WWE3 bacterium RIFCSPHIGHO2_01_FULL_40_23]|uniref:Uncharacterized protein n=1 Tax=candidate division WWE3 bacterium RIFCSPLOWO2_01_FULL_41_18 TaxID=1802625 RepID=A0A1F4VDH1_UNCKA|nr:MAG: hypothetical protein A2716_05280 [candidate division WWE3 bacterium RIFCSPHIGHO2_01_FULL_40_23]OGC55281.1 MAG: hypothetical protein A3A78_04890 [candidate division WWE3 bacterium RIFCSPLOWO2_01_FULL_41_18]